MLKRMTFDDWRTEHPALIQILKDRLGGKKTCSDVIDAYEEVMRSIWSFTAQFLGDAGTRAVLARSLRFAALDAPLLEGVLVRDREVDFSGLRDHAAKMGCDVSQVLDALLLLGVTIFRTLSELSGDAITGPLLTRVDKGK